MGSSCSSDKSAVAVYNDDLSTSHIKMEPKTPMSAITLTDSSNTITGSRRTTSKFAIGEFEKYTDLEYTKDIHRPGWLVEDGSMISYSILMEEIIGVKLLRKFKRCPAVSLVPEYCSGVVQRCEYKGYNMVVFKITHPDNNKIMIERCTRKLRASGPPEFDNIMTFYGTDYHIVFTNWLQEERSLRALSNTDGYF